MQLLSGMTVKVGMEKSKLLGGEKEINRLSGMTNEGPNLVNCVVLTLWYQRTFCTSGLALMWHSKYTSSSSLMFSGLRLLPICRVTTGLSVGGEGGVELKR